VTGPMTRKALALLDKGPAPSVSGGAFVEEPVAAGGSSDGTAHRSTPQAGRSSVSFPTGDRPAALWREEIGAGKPEATAGEVRNSGQPAPVGAA
jgi:hypothetical protein